MSPQETRPAVDRREGLEPIAIVGLACRFPGAGDPRAFWSLLRDGGDAVSQVPRDRWDVEAFFDRDAEAPGKMTSRWGGFLEQVDRFDAEFFGISAGEAVSMDPQHRLLLELSWEALEDAGLVAADLAGTQAGVFVGISTNDYGQIEARDPLAVTAYWSIGNALNIAASRISYFYDLRGPAVAIDTACSASLVAVHYACSSLWSGDCVLAFAGGANLILSPTPMINFTKAGALSPDGRCKAFDARADGIVRGEGGGLVVLKPLSRALADGDPVRAVIRGSAVNQDGRTNGLTAPSRHAQEAVLRAAYRSAGVPPGAVQYVEAHGTGTLLGDPIEMKALGAVVSAGRRDDQPCAVGSVKSNIGHLESAAGIASLIKVVLSLEHGEVPPSIHFREPNPHIPFESLRLRVQDALGAWPADGPAIAGVSSFGFGGTNAHVVVEQAPRPQLPAAAGSPDEAVHLLPLSGRVFEGLQDMARSWIRWLKEDPAGTDLRDLCFTASLRRSHHAHRLGVAFRTRDELVQGLEGVLEGREGPASRFSQGGAPRRQPKVVFVYSGQGAGWWPVRAGLLEQEPVLSRTLEGCDAILLPLTGRSLLEEMVSREQVPQDEMEFLQPAVVAFQIALTALWRSWGIDPDAVVGHSLGELSAAHASGAVSLEDALHIAHQRGRLMQQGLKEETDRGGMAAAKLSLEAARRLVSDSGGRISIAAQNGPNHVILAGPVSELEPVLRALEEQRIAARLLPVPGAGHGRGVGLLAGELVRRVSAVRAKPAAIPFYSTVTGQLASGEQLGAEHWGRNMAEPVLFSDAVKAMIQARHDIYLEVGRHPLLAGPLRECLAAEKRRGTILASLRRGEDERLTLLGSLGALYSRGRTVRWSSLYPHGGRCVALPSYPWRRRRFWFGDASAPSSEARPQGHARMEPARDGRRDLLLGRPLRSAASPDMHYWQTWLDAERFPSLREYRLEGLGLIPPAFWIELFFAVADSALPGSAASLEDLRFLGPLFLPKGGGRELQVSLVRNRDGGEARVYALPPDGAKEETFEATVVAEARIRKNPDSQGAGGAEPIEQILGRCSERRPGAELYAGLAEGGLRLGAPFRPLEELFLGSEETLARMCVLESPPRTHSGVPLEVLDAGIQAATNGGLFQGSGVFWPTAIARVDRSADTIGSAPLWAHVVPSPLNEGMRGDEGCSPARDVLYRDQHGRPRLAVRGIRAEGIARSMQASALLDWTYTVTWTPRDRRRVAIGEPGRWIVLCDRGGVGEAVASRLDAAGCPVLRVYPRRAGDRAPAGCCGLDPTSVSAFLDVIDQAGSSGLPLRGLVHLWALDAPDTGALTLRSLEEAQVLGCGSALLAVQSLARKAGADPSRLWLVTRGAQPVRPGPLSIAQSPLWGFGHAIAAEKRTLWGGIVDLDPSASVQEQSAWLCDEILCADGEDRIAVRDGVRYAARLSRSEAEVVPRGGSWTGEGAYLLSGGLGDLGLLVARWMAERGVRCLVLLGRTPLPSRADWDGLDHDSRAGRQVAAIRAIEALGATVHARAVDVADQEAMAELLRGLRRDVGPLRGVVHLAGATPGAPLEDMDLASLAAELRPKVLGGWLLHSLLALEPLEHFVLFSSASAVLGSPLLSGYAAANAFLDALAHHRRGVGRRALSIDWGYWEEAGLAARRLRELGRASAPRGMLGFTNGQGLAVFEHLLGRDAPQAAVMHYDWRTWSRFHEAAASAPFLEEIFARPEPRSAASRSSASLGQVRETLRSLDPQAGRAMLESYVLERVAAALGVPPSEVSSDQPLTTLGVDSLTALELKNRIELELGIRLPVSDLVQGPTIAELCGSMLDRLRKGSPEPTPEGTGADAAQGSPEPLPTLEEPAKLLRRMDELTDEQVEELLRSMGVGD